MTRANSAKYFLLGLTQDGSILMQENFGASMTLSRFIKKSDFSFNDGFRHFVKYTRLNQTIQISVDYQSYLPSMNVAGGGITINTTTSGNATIATKPKKHSNVSFILVGTADDESVPLFNVISERTGVANLTHYCGCISNLIVKLDDYSLEPLSETFGQHIDTSNATSTSSVSEGSFISFVDTWKQDTGQRLAELKATEGELIKPIKALNVEQGKCASFRKKPNDFNYFDRKPLNEPKSTSQTLDQKSVFVDPPRIRPYKVNQNLQLNGHREITRKKTSFDTKFYISLSILLIVFSTTVVYAYTLQVRYQAEKFRCETPFFHKRNAKHKQVRDKSIN